MENSFIIENLLEQQKGTRLEFKATVNKEAIAKTIAAFINTQGGDLLIGVEGNKKIMGIENAEKIRASIQPGFCSWLQNLPVGPTKALFGALSGLTLTKMLRILRQPKANFAIAKFYLTTL
jgi:Putative DNA-binding domain